MPQKDDKTPVLRDFREPNHTRIDNMFYSGGYAAIMGATAVSILGALCKHYDVKTHKTRLSSQKIMELTGLSNHQVYKILSQLKYYHIIDYTPMRGKGKCNEYIHLHCSTWKPITKCEHSSHFKKHKATTMLQPKYERSSHYSIPKCELREKQNVNVVHTFKRSSSFKGSGGCSENLSCSNIGDPDLQKMPVPENGNSASKIALKTTTQIMKNLPQEKNEEEIIQRKNALKQQLQQIYQEGTL